MSGFFDELQRRKVYRVAVAYIIAAGFLIQIACSIGGNRTGVSVSIL